MNIALGEHGVVLKLGLAERGGVACIELEARPTFKYKSRDLPAMMTSLAFPERRALRVDLYPSTYFPDFITSARRELMDSEPVFLTFLIGAVLSRQSSCFRAGLPRRGNNIPISALPFVDL